MGHCTDPVPALLQPGRHKGPGGREQRQAKQAGWHQPFMGAFLSCTTLISVPLASSAFTTPLCSSGQEESSVLSQNKLHAKLQQPMVLCLPSTAACPASYTLHFPVHSHSFGCFLSHRCAEGEYECTGLQNPSLSHMG